MSRRAALIVSVVLAAVALAVGLLRFGSCRNREARRSRSARSEHVLGGCLGGLFGALAIAWGVISWFMDELRLSLEAQQRIIREAE